MMWKGLTDDKHTRRLRSAATPKPSTSQKGLSNRRYLGIHTCSAGRGCVPCRVTAWVVWGVAAAAVATLAFLLIIAAFERG